MDYKLIIFVAIIAVTIILFILEYNLKYKKEKEKEDLPFVAIKKKNIELINTMLAEGYFDKVNALIDSFISVAGDNYTVFALSSNSNHYLTESDQETMTKYIYGNVKRNITPEVKDVISTVYIIDDEEEDNEHNKLNQLINVRIKLYMINFIRNFNSLPEDIPNMKG